MTKHIGTGDRVVLPWAVAVVLLVAPIATIVYTAHVAQATRGFIIAFVINLACTAAIIAWPSSRRGGGTRTTSPAGVLVHRNAGGVYFIVGFLSAFNALRNETVTIPLVFFLVLLVALVFFNRFLLRTRRDTRL
ncbi:hypothetical protein [Corynebacterium aquilae]|uniref:Uncharacterized protein n=1 Tax=Corynebacterium aquilae DSM 44791 TaxID=1431546 RepID=A0A1L7CDW4_9CORY|nr:hypothetical protein [Corynebacterium aquilae]APT84027.1 hypothetical protein CAQU_01890 [Corynebacterium aquilae DSM 44791]